MIMMNEIKKIFNQLGFTIIYEISEGFSADKKYVAKKKSELYLIKVFNANAMDEKEKEFDILKKVEEINVKSSKPIDIGTFNNFGYMITSYLAGKDGKKILPKLDTGMQYKLGLEAGEQLFRIHTITPNRPLESWDKRQNKKYHNKLAIYCKNNITFFNDDKVIKFIDENINYMKTRKNVLQHDDFHAGNLIFKNNQISGVIDFGSFDWGDSFHDFLKLGLFSRNISIPFAIGQIHGYFGKDPSTDFWILYSLYLGMEMISSVNWCLELYPSQLNKMLDSFNIILKDHNNFSQIMPKWYRSIKKDGLIL